MTVLAASLMLVAAQTATVPAPLPTPSADAMEAARTISRNSVIVSLVPLQTKAEIEKMIVDNPGLSDTEKERLRTIGQREADAMMARFVEADAAAHAARLSVEDLRAIAAYESSPAAARRRTAMPAIIEATMARLGDADFGKAVRTAFCAETGKLCQ